MYHEIVTRHRRRRVDPKREYNPLGQILKVEVERGCQEWVIDLFYDVDDSLEKVMVDIPKWILYATDRPLLENVVSGPERGEVGKSICVDLVLVNDDEQVRMR